MKTPGLPLSNRSFLPAVRKIKSIDDASEIIRQMLRAGYLAHDPEDRDDWRISSNLRRAAIENEAHLNCSSRLLEQDEKDDLTMLMSEGKIDWLTYLTSEEQSRYQNGYEKVIAARNALMDGFKEVEAVAERLDTLRKQRFDAERTLEKEFEEVFKRAHRTRQKQLQLAKKGTALDDIRKHARPITYFIEAVGTGRVKIGFTEGDPQARLSNLQTGSAVELRLLATVDCSESDLHTHFQSTRSHGEWFEKTDSLASMVSHITSQGSLPPKDTWPALFPMIGPAA